MASSYPGSLDSFDTIASDKKTSDVVGGRTHRQMHNDVADALEAVQAELGTDPAGAYSTVKARLDALVAYAAKTGAYTATVADHTLNVTSGTFTLDLPAASTCTGQSLNIRNSGTGVVTLDGNSAETVDGVATFPLGTGSYVEVTSTGAAWILTGGTPDTRLRDIASVLSNGWTATTFLVSRVGNHVEIEIQGLSGAAASAATFLTASALKLGVPRMTGTYSSTGRLTNGHSGTTPFGIYYSMNTSGFCADRGPVTAGWGRLSFHTSSAWPTSLPGSAV